MSALREAGATTDRTNLRVYLAVVRAMRLRGVARVDVRVVEPYPYPEVAGCWDMFDGAILDSGDVLRNGVAVKGLAARARLVRTMVELGQNKRLTPQSTRTDAA